MRRTLKNRTCAVILAGTFIAGCQAGTAWAGMAETLPMTGTERAAVVEPAPVMETDGTGETTKESGSETLENIALTRLENDGIAAVKTDGVEAGADQFSTKVTYQTYDPDANAAAHLPETVEVNGETYHVLEWKTPLVVSKEATRPRTMSYESEVFTGDEAEHMPEQEVTGEDGLNYVLQSKTLNAQTTKERSEYKETTVSYKGVEAGVQIQDKKEIEFQDTDTGQTVKAPLNLVNQTVKKEYWDDTFQFDITIHGYDADILVLNGKEIPKDSDLMDYKDDLLAILHLDPSAYRISSIDLQPVEGESDTRTATAYGSKLVRDIDAVYSGTVTLPSISGKTWSCIYEEKIPDAERTIYTMSVTVSYEKGDGTAQSKSLFERVKDAVVGFITAAYQAAAAAFEEHPVITSIPVILAAAFIAFLITRKVRNRCIYNGEMKCLYKKHNKDICKSCPHYRQRNSV